ncbi:unnamed protein product [Echinostoma caproni]|uniref:SEC7 domain-containing protein n=1 Tax=Echinostoma caproni TaxID=27848 RepID=A0A183AML1_9TREM|nr:unnamed protein product [Echinostoma caproni]
MKQVIDKEQENGEIRRLAVRRPILKRKNLLPEVLCCCKPRPENIHICKLSSVMNADEPDSPQPGEASQSVQNCDSTENDVSLPIRAPSSSHSKFLSGCMPIHGLRRSASSPRHSSRRTIISNTRNVSVRNQNITSPVNDEANQPVEASKANISSDLWDNEGSFKWRKVRPSATIHHTNLSALKPSHLWIRHKHTSVSESSNMSQSISPLGTPLTDTTSVFRDPMLEELDAELPVPPPPPRAYPPWLKLALLKQQREHTSNPVTPTTDSSIPCSGLSRSQTCDYSTRAGSRPGLNKQKSISLENDRYGIRIYPVIQDGVKISDTHYWLLDAPQPRHVLPPCPCAESVPISSSPLNEAGDYLNVPAGVNLRRERSEPSRQALNNIHYQMVQRLLEAVPEATEAECQAVLIGAGYHYEEAMRRLKLELLRRLGYFSRSQFKRILQKVDWNLPLAMDKVRRAMHARSKSTMQSSNPSGSLSDPNSASLSPTPTTDTQTADIPQFSGTLDVLQSPTSPISTNLLDSPGVNSTSAQHLNIAHKNRAYPFRSTEPP